MPPTPVLQRGGNITARVVMEDSTQVAGQPVRFVVEVHNPPTKPVSSIKARTGKSWGKGGWGKMKSRGTAPHLAHSLPGHAAWLLIVFAPAPLLRAGQGDAGAGSGGRRQGRGGRQPAEPAG